MGSNDSQHGGHPWGQVPTLWFSRCPGGDGAGVLPHIIAGVSDLSADSVQREIFRKLGPEGRVQVAAEMSDENRELAAEGVRSRHPEYDEANVRLAVLRLTLGEPLFARVFPSADVQP